MPSYQNGGPRKIEEIGLSATELQRKKSFRGVLFGSLGVIFLLSFLAMALVVHQHQKQAHAEEDDYVYSDDGTSGLKPIISIDDLHLQTNTSIPSGCETTIILIRHCEKEGDETIDEDGNEHCNYVGYERSQFIPSLFGVPGHGDNKWPVPSALFALTESRSSNFNFREIETLTPLAQLYGLEIESDVQHNNALVKRLFKGLAKGHWCGKTVLVAWKHEFLGGLAQQLGCVDCPVDYPELVFDEVWQLKYVYDVGGTQVIQSSRMKPTVGPATENKTVRRALKRKKVRKGATKKVRKEAASSIPLKTWSVYSTITAQNFDPLKFSFSAGDYSNGPAGGKWFHSHDTGSKTPNEGEM